MNKKFNLALIPILKSNEFVAVAQKFSSISDKYLLGKRSFPHVTLYQFEAEENEINDIWKNILDSWNQPPIILELAEFSYITFDSQTYWISLLPKTSDILHKMHILISDLLKLPAKKNYDPHLTLLNTKNNHHHNEIKNIADIFMPISDTFKLSLGRSDEIGQFIEIISQV